MACSEIHHRSGSGADDGAGEVVGLAAVQDALHAEVEASGAWSWDEAMVIMGRVVVAAALAVDHEGDERPLAPVELAELAALAIAGPGPSRSLARRLGRSRSDEDDLSLAPAVLEAGGRVGPLDVEALTEALAAAGAASGEFDGCRAMVLSGVLVTWLSRWRPRGWVTPDELRGARRAVLAVAGHDGAGRLLGGRRLVPQAGVVAAVVSWLERLSAAA